MTSLNVFRWCNLALTFFLELAALAILSYAGAQLGSGAGAVALAIAAPLAAAILWGLFAAPRSVVHLQAATVGVKVSVFALAWLGLYANGHKALSATFAGLVVVNALIVHSAGKPTQLLTAS